MVRAILPKAESPPTVPAQQHPPQQDPPQKRRCISSACLPCRRRKSKCDGGSPSCSTCSAVYQMECVYDTDSDRRRKSTLKRDIEQLKSKKESLDELIQKIQCASEEEVAGIVERIRGGEGAAGEGVKDVGVLEVDERGGLRHVGRRTSLGAVHAHPRVPSVVVRSEDTQPATWTSVTSDDSFISELLSLYFTWHHPHHPLLSKSCFFYDLKRHRHKYCAPLLMNAILALACHYSPSPAARAIPSDPSSVGDHFFAEAKRLLQTDEENPSVTLAQALALMSLRESGCGRDASGWMYSGRAFRVALDLGLQIHVEASDVQLAFSPTEAEVRKITFWGLFHIDKLLSHQFGRVPQLPSSITSTPRPSIIAPLEAEPWPPASACSPPSHLQAVAGEMYTLSTLLGDILTTLHTPHTPPMTPAKRHIFAARLRACRESLPVFLEAPATPAALVLHLWYHTIRAMIGDVEAQGLRNTLTAMHRAGYDAKPPACVVHMVLACALALQDAGEEVVECEAVLKRCASVWGCAEQALWALQGHGQWWVGLEGIEVEWRRVA